MEPAPGLAQRLRTRVPNSGSISTSNPSRSISEQETDPLLHGGNLLVDSRGYDSHSIVLSQAENGSGSEGEPGSEGFEDVDDVFETAGDGDAPVKPGNVPNGTRELGLMSTSFLIINRMIGTGIFATPSAILRSSGSVGFSLVMWFLGASVAACGTAVFIELGTGIPKSGGEKNYLEFFYRRPRFLATCVYGTYAILGAYEAANSSVFSEYILHALNPTVTPPQYLSRLVALCCITFALILHGTKLTWGLRLQNALGVFKIFVLVGIALSGLAVLAGIPGFELREPPRNFEWGTMWKGSLSGGVNAFVIGLYNVIWAFDGYTNANYALSEVRDPVRTIKRTAPLAVFSITVAYMLVNVAYYAVVDKEDILGSGRIAAALFFGRLWGVETERIVSLVIALSALGSVLAVLFTHGRVIQELGKEGAIPFSGFFASNKPFNAPFPGLFAQWLTTSTVIALIPQGDAYLFFLNLSSYPFAIINMFVSGGLLLLHTSVLKYEWDPPFKAYRFVVVLFFLSNILLVFAPLVPPAGEFKPYANLPYWLHVGVAMSMSLIGVGYWYIWAKWLPARGRYRLVRKRVIDDDGTLRSVLKKVELDEVSQ